MQWKPLYDIKHGLLNWFSNKKVRPVVKVGLSDLHVYEIKTIRQNGNITKCLVLFLPLNL